MQATQTIRYGLDSQIQVSLSAEALIAQCGDPRGNALDDPVAAVAAALVEPLEHPPLAESTVPGDRIVIAVEGGVPQLSAVVAGVIQALVEGSVAPQNIRILLAGENASVEDVKSLLPVSYARDVHVQFHDSHDRGQLAYLATTQKGTPIYINRFICDADLVIPVGCIRADGALGAVGTLSGVYPSFADAATRRRFRAPESLRSAKGLARLTRELDEATWLLGARFTVQTIPGGGDGLLDVIAGDRDAVQQAGRKRSHAAWGFSVPQRARLVIAAVEGGPAQQTWDGFARALLAALRVAEDDGTVAICTELAHRPGPDLSLLIGELDLDKIEAKIGRKPRADALAATQLIDALRRVRVYLLSRLDREVVEDLGLGHIERPQEVANLCRRHATCILLANSQHAWPSVAADSMVSP